MAMNLRADSTFKYWKLNVSLVTNAHMKQEIKSAVTEYAAMNNNRTVSPSVLWDASKATMRRKIISLGSHLKKQRLVKQVELRNETE